MTPFQPRSALAIDPLHAGGTDVTAGAAPALSQILAEQQLAPADAQTVTGLAQRLDAAQPLSVQDLGSDAAAQSTVYADKILAQVRNSDLGEMGRKLGEIVLAAKAIQLGPQGPQRSRLPLIGGLLDRFKLSQESLVQQFQSTDQQLDKLVKDVEGSQQSLRRQVQDLDQAFALTQQEFHQLGLAVAAGKLKLSQIEAELAQAGGAAAAPEAMEAQRQHDVRQYAERLAKRVGDLQALRVSALQTLPMIRIIQNNSQLLVEKFQSIKELTLPAWRRQFMLALSLGEQRQAVALAQNIDDATNEFLRRNAELLKSNAVDTARANQRAVIDVETLVQVQQTLVQTVEEVLAIQREGQGRRRDAEQRLAVLQGELRSAMTRA